MSPIGVMDSGFGGLTVLKALTSAAPARPFVFLGDHAHAPFGPRDFDDIKRLTIRGVETLFDRGCRLVILACNTQAAVALRHIQQNWLPARGNGRNVLGVLVPVVEAITRVPWVIDAPPPGRSVEPRAVGVFATKATVDSESFPAEIGKRAPEVRVIQQACPDLVPMIEAGAAETEIEPVVRRYVDELLTRTDERPLDAAVLGCTHYPLVERLFREALPEGLEILDQARLTALSLEHYLERHPEYRPNESGDAPTLRFLTTGDPDNVSRLALRFLGRSAVFERVEFKGEA